MLPPITVSIHLTDKAAQTSDYSILTLNRVIHEGMDYIKRNNAKFIEIKSDRNEHEFGEGTVVLNADGTWYYRSSDIILHPQNIK